MKLINRGKTKELYSFEGGFPKKSDFTYSSQRYSVVNREVLNVNNDGSVGLLFDDGELEQVAKASQISPEEFDKTINKIFRRGSK